MSPFERSVIRRLGAALACALFALVGVAGPVAGSTVTFGAPSATSKFGTGIVFTQPYVGTIKSAGILISSPGDVGPSVAAIANPGSSSLVYTLDTSAGGPAPFTPVLGQFEVVLSDGTTLDGPEIPITYGDDRFTWTTITGKVVRLHFINASDGFAQQMLNLADAGVAKAAALFGVAESQPIDYYVYPSLSDFQQGLSEPSTIGGTAREGLRLAYAVIAPGDTASAAHAMPHEPTHVVFWDATHNPYHRPPRWLNEGLAQYVSLGYDPGSRQLVSQAVHDGTLVPLLALTDYFPFDASRIYLAYAESVSAVDFMIRKYGQPAVRTLVKAYAAGVTDDEAFKTGLGVDVATFDSAWLADNGVTASQTVGPQPAPAGPVPPGWTGSGGGSTATAQSAARQTAAPPSGAGQSSPTGQSTSDNTSVALLLAGLIAAAGLALLVVALVVYMRPRGRPAP